ncbi:hypothetical protein TanjilG_05459 [Lupinus angustifolius]|uniref:Uncharacterized protein n=1 Tax=Lupinus angustifolius TaxID=3871 RepID=A0A4P1QSR6_LUPAN|nr:hypothetical protein TanjilG_05459 [Lupinus angustifolius]
MKKKTEKPTCSSAPNHRETRVLRQKSCRRVNRRRRRKDGGSRNRHPHPAVGTTEAPPPWLSHIQAETCHLAVEWTQDRKVVTTTVRGVVSSVISIVPSPSSIPITKGSWRLNEEENLFTLFLPNNEPDYTKYEPLIFTQPNLLPLGPFLFRFKH